MTLLASEGVQRLVDERKAKRSELERAQKCAESVIERADQGILERDLIAKLMEDAEVSRSVASSAADYLRAIGAVQKNWATGLLTHIVG